MEKIIALFGTPQIYWIVILTAIDVVLGIIAAILKKEFRLGKLAGFMKKGVIGYILGFVVLEAVVLSIPSFRWIVRIAFVLIILALIGSILNNIGKMGAVLPPYLKRD
jgi:FtsH-binding integral membrane protein